MNADLRQRKFIQEISDLRKAFPEHAKEIDKCVYAVLKKKFCCNRSKCPCQMTFEQFHNATNQSIVKSCY